MRLTSVSWSSCTTAKLLQKTRLDQCQVLVWRGSSLLGSKHSGTDWFLEQATLREDTSKLLFERCDALFQFIHNLPFRIRQPAVFQDDVLVRSSHNAARDAEQLSGTG